MPESGSASESGTSGSTASSTTGESGTQSGAAGSGGQTGQASGGLPEYGSGGAGGEGDIAYGSEDDPFGGIGSNSEVSGEGGGQGGSGELSNQARIEVLDERLEEGYEVFDGMILGERERAQGAADEEGAGGGAGGSDPYGGLGIPGEGEGGGGDGSDGQVIARNSGGANAGGGYMPDVPSREGDFENSNQAQFPVPEDIPDGNDDDVVARQLREAAMNEPDPELREKLWDEYRAYTGLDK